MSAFDPKRTITMRRFFVTSVSGSILIAGALLCLNSCVTGSYMEALHKGDAKLRAEYDKPAFTDEIVAIARPDAELAKKLNNPHVVAFLGLKNTYVLLKGGEELEAMAQLPIDRQRLNVAQSRVFLKDKQVWGQLTVIYSDGGSLTATERSVLEQAGFAVIGWALKTVSVEGVVYPAMKLSSEQESVLTRHQHVNFFDPSSSDTPSVNTGYLFIPIAVAADVALTPLYLGLGAVSLVMRHPGQ